MTGLRMACVIGLLGLLSACVKTGDIKENTGSPEKAAEANFSLGVEYFRKNNLTVAYDKFKKSVSQDNSNPQAHAFLALVAEQLEQKDEARKHYALASKLDNKDPVIQNMYGAYLCRQGNSTGAERLFLAAAENRFYTTPEAAYANAGSCALKAGRYATALEHLDKALKIRPGYTLALWNMAQLHYEQERDLQARAFLERIGKLEQLPPEALLLGYRIADRSGNRMVRGAYAAQLKERFPESVQTTELLEIERNGG